MVALSHPPIATALEVVGTVTRKRPAVVRSPDDGCVDGGEVLKQDFVVEIESVYVVQMDNIWLSCLYLFDKFASSPI